MEKQEALSRWVKLDPDQQILPHFTPIAADAHGSTFGACGIRVSGNPAFIDAVLSRLKDLLEAESGSTRLVLSRQPVKPVAIEKGGKVTSKSWNNAEADAEVCYIQIRERTGRTRHRKALERSDDLPRSNAKSARKGDPIPAVKPVRKGDLFESAEMPHAPEPEEPPKVAHIGSRNGEVLWDEEEGEES